MRGPQRLVERNNSWSGERLVRRGSGTTLDFGHSSLALPRTRASGVPRSKKRRAFSARPYSPQTLRPCSQHRVVRRRRLHWRDWRRKNLCRRAFGDLWQRNLQRVIDRFHVVNRQPLQLLWRQVLFQVHLVFRWKNYVSHSSTFRRKNFFLDPAHGKNIPAQRDLAGHRGQRTNLLTKDHLSESPPPARARECRGWRRTLHPDPTLAHSIAPSYALPASTRASHPESGR